MLVRAVLAFFVLALIGCGINSVTTAEIEAIKPGNKITYRFRKGDKSWFSADRITRVEGDTIYYNPGKYESTRGGDSRLDEYDPREMSIKKAEMIKYATEQPPDDKKIIWIE